MRKRLCLLAAMLCTIAFLGLACTNGSESVTPTESPTVTSTGTSQQGNDAFSEAEQVKLASLTSNISHEVMEEFDTKYQAWEATWYTPELLVQSNPRAFTQSNEYKTFLSFCRNQGKVVWPLLFQKMEGTSLEDSLIAEVIGDLTLFEYGQILDSTRHESLELYNREGIFVDPFMMYVKELLSLL